MKISLLLLVLIFSGCSDVSYAYTNEEIVNAIYKAEGGEKAKYPYGIKSVKCETIKECREACRKTVQNNRRRYSIINNGLSSDGGYLSYLAWRYCPTKGNLSKAERAVNKNWLKNVTYFLTKGSKNGTIRNN